MDKTKVKIETYLSTVNVKSEEDRQRILNFCAERGRKIWVAKKKPFIPGLKEISFEEFEKWYNEASYGDIIKLESGGIGIVKNVSEQKITLYTLLYPDGRFYDSETIIPFEDYQEATLEDMKPLQFELSKNNLQWNKTSNILIQKIYTKENEHIRLSVLGNKVGYGIFKEIENNNLILYCVQIEDEPVRYSLHEDMGDYRYYQFEKVTVHERETFKEHLQNQEKDWNGFNSRIVHPDYRIKGGRYFYITDKFTVEAAIDQRPRDERRFNKGNYFRDKEDAVALLSEIEQWQKEYWKRWTPKHEKQTKAKKNKNS